MLVRFFKKGRVLTAVQESRDCFVQPIPEMECAVELLKEAADAILCGDPETARGRLLQADMCVVHKHASKILGKMDPEIHRYRPVPGGDTIPPLSPAGRMPGAELTRQILARDGYRCRYCGCRVAVKQARKIMCELFPKECRWGPRNQDQHAAYFALTAVLDHVVPWQKGGTNHAQNLVTSCQPCNYGKMQFLLEELALTDPRDRPPVVDDWDGLSRFADAWWLGIDFRSEPVSVVQARRRAWLTGVESLHPGIYSRLRQFLDDCKPLPLFCRLNTVLVAHLITGDGTIRVFGVRSDGAVEIPWDIGGQKDAFRPFAEAVAAAIPGATAVESPKVWSVRKKRRPINLTELLDASPVVLAALAQLHTGLDGSACGGR